jgi:predicted PurR-regulated permease PerM
MSFNRILAISVIVVLAVLLLTVLGIYLLPGGNPVVNAATSNTFVGKIISWLEDRYSSPGFNARGTDVNMSEINLTHEGIDSTGIDTTPTPGPTMINKSINLQNQSFVKV